MAVQVSPWWLYKSVFFPFPDFSDDDRSIAGQTVWATMKSWKASKFRLIDSVGHNCQSCHLDVYWQ